MPVPTSEFSSRFSPRDTIISAGEDNGRFRRRRAVSRPSGRARSARAWRARHDPVTSLGAPSTLRADSRPDELELPNAARYLTILGIIGSYFMWTLPLGSWNIN